MASRFRAEHSRLAIALAWLWRLGEGFEPSDDTVDIVAPGRIAHFDPLPPAKARMANRVFAAIADEDAR